MTTKTQLKSGDTIRVARQPANQWVGIRGEVGRIDEIQGDHATIDTFDLKNQKGSGSGSVPLDCLEPYSDPRLDSAIARRDAEVAVVWAQCQERRRRWMTLVAELAAKHGVPEKAVDEIMNAGRNFD